ncbi:cysteine proteinase [Saccharata proteae CBS 121410]|uniref:Cysteine proteinase n=1 Tax=Saccharata proteae CBS 121410 TaxID=1314787 RepID=A0A9P4HWR4_9PEZI|nr:cysteine proteinase [Saccharata proteae CBS 121410]
MSGFHPFNGRISRHFGENLAPDDAYLSLTKEDVDCIKNDWLTDNGISFWEEYLEHEHLKAYPKATINLLRPSMSFMLMQTPDPLTLRDALPGFRSSTHIFLPINDCHNVNEAEGGSHWSLLLVSVVDGVAFHYDSLSASNENDARTCTQKMATLLGKSFRYIEMKDSPQQENGNDCGIFVCLLMRYLLMNRLLKVDSREKISMSMSGKVVDASHGRKEILKIIESARKEGRRRRSSNNSRNSHSKSPPRIGDD